MVAMGFSFSREIHLQGDTSAGLIARILGTAFGGFVGAALWFGFRPLIFSPTYSPPR